MTKQDNWQKTRYATDPIFREAKKLRSLLTRAIRNPDKRVYSALTAALGVTSVEMCKHLEHQFSTGMSWNTYGSTWEIDHIVPLATAQTIQDVHRLFYYMNLQPLEPHKNRLGAPCKVTAEKKV